MFQPETKQLGVTLKDMENKFFSTINVPKVLDGAHRLAMSVLLAVTTMPKTAVSTFPILATLGHVTEKLEKICGWNPQMADRVKQNCKAQNKKLVIPGVIQKFFDKLNPNANVGSMECPSPALGVYYKLIMAELAQAKLNGQFWRTNVRQQDLQLAQKLFNKPDSDMAIIASELLELCDSDASIVAHSSFNIDAMSEPGSHFSGLDAARDLSLELRQEREDAYLNASLSEDSARWTDCDLQFFDQNQQSALFRVDGNCCLYYDYDQNAFCDKPAVNKTARCHQHRDTANSKFMSILTRMNQKEYKIGFSLAAEAFRFFTEPQMHSDVVEYAPYFEGSIPPFLHSANNMKKVLQACYKSYKAGYLTSSSVGFRDNFFKEYFPNENISTRDYMFTYLSIRVC